MYSRGALSLPPPSPSSYLLTVLFFFFSLSRFRTLAPPRAGRYAALSRPERETDRGLTQQRVE